MLKVAQNIKGGWIQRFKPSSYNFPNSEKALADAVEAAGPTLGPALISMSEYLMSSFNESYQSRCVSFIRLLNSCFFFLFFFFIIFRTVKQLRNRNGCGKFLLVVEPMGICIIINPY